MLDGLCICHAFVVTSGLGKLPVFSADYYHHHVRSNQIPWTADLNTMGWSLDQCKCVIKWLLLLYPFTVKILLRLQLNKVLYRLISAGQWLYTRIVLLTFPYSCIIWQLINWYRKCFLSWSCDCQSVFFLVNVIYRFFSISRSTRAIFKFQKLRSLLEITQNI